MLAGLLGGAPRSSDTAQDAGHGERPQANADFRPLLKSCDAMKATEAALDCLEQFCSEHRDSKDAVVAALNKRRALAMKEGANPKTTLRVAVIIKNWWTELNELDPDLGATALPDAYAAVSRYAKSSLKNKKTDEVLFAADVIDEWRQLSGKLPSVDTKALRTQVERVGAEKEAGAEQQRQEEERAGRTKDGSKRHWNFCVKCPPYDDLDCAPTGYGATLAEGMTSGCKRECDRFGGAVLEQCVEECATTYRVGRKAGDLYGADDCQYSVRLEKPSAR